jgi:hypothetical protein
MVVDQSQLVMVMGMSQLVEELSSLEMGCRGVRWGREMGRARAMEKQR